MKILRRKFCFAKQECGGRGSSCKDLSHRGSPDAKAQAVQCPQKVRTSPANSSGVQTPFPKPAPRENVLFELGSNRVNMRGMYKADELWYKGARNEPESLHSMSSSGFHSTKPSPGANYSTTNSAHNSICCESGGNSRIWTIGNVINKNRTILYLIIPAEAAMEREQLRSRWNVDKIGGGGGGGNIADKSAFPNL